MALPAQLLRSQGSRAAWLDGNSNAERETVLSQHGTLSITDIVPAHGPGLVLDHAASVERTRGALLTLDHCPGDLVARAALWGENRDAIEAQMLLHLDDPDSAAFEYILSRLAAGARFFCEEIDDPKAWVERCANLEARRFALELAE
jgi:hypothetical protein